MNEFNATGDVETLVATAQSRFQARDFTGALEAFSELCRLRPNSAHFADRYAHCYSALKQFPQAQEAWSQAIAKHGPTIGRVTALALCCIERQDYAAALTILDSSSHKISMNANFFVFSTIAALGIGDIGHAFDSAKHVERLAAEENVPAINYLAGLLDRLGRQGHVENVLRLVDLLLPSIVKPWRLLQTGIAMSTLIKRLETWLKYASELIRLEPNVTDGYVQQINALLEFGRFDECQRLLGELDSRFPPSVRSTEDDKVFGRLEFQIDSRLMWEQRLRAADGSLSFQSLNFRANAHKTLRQYERAIEVATTGVAIHEGHPWFMVLLGKCYEEIGDLETSLRWFAKAADNSLGETNCLLHLCRVQVKSGLTDAALRTARVLIERHPNLPAVNSIFEKLGRNKNDQFNENERRQDASRSAQEAWLHGGDSGDLIYALASMQAGGGGYLYLTCIDGTREPMIDSKIEFLAPLLSAQHYIKGVRAWAGEPVANDFTLFRHLMLPNVDLATQQWWCVSDDKQLDVKAAWLRVPIEIKHARPVFARSNRYRNRNWDAFWGELKAGSPDALFVGTTDEFAEFGHGEHYLAHNALELAQTICGASVFVGNQSLPYAIAEALKVARLLEVSPYIQNCVFPGALSLGFRGSLER